MRLSNLIFITLFVCLGCSRADQSEEQLSVKIFAAISLKSSLDQVAAEFTSKTGQPVELSYGASNQLAEMITQGATADLLLSANQKWSDYVTDSIAFSAKREFLSNQLVLVAPINSGIKIDSIHDLMKSDVNLIAIANDQVPLGAYTIEAFENLNLFEPLKNSQKFILTSNAKTTLLYADRGEVDAAIVYQSDAVLSSKIKLIELIDPKLHQKITYEAILFPSNQQNPAASEFYQYLLEQECQNIFLMHKFVITNQVLKD